MPKKGDEPLSGLPVVPREALSFLRGLKANNSKAWFKAHRGEYDRFVLEPMQALSVALAPFVLDVDPRIETEPRVDRTISRIRRDTRFSKDKAPYRANVWLVFKRRDPYWTDIPAFFFEFSPGAYRYGMGYYSAAAASMGAFRARLDADPKAFLTAIRPIEKEFVVEGEAYKKPFPGARDARIEEYYRRKSFYLVRNGMPDAAFHSPSLAERIGRGFASLCPFYRYLVESK